jgi:hypothetical protein
MRRSGPGVSVAVQSASLVAESLSLGRQVAMRVRSFIPLAVGLLFLGVALVVWSGRRPVPSPIRVAWVGTTNDSTGALLYCFQATNTAGRDFMVSYQTQVRSSSGGSGERSAMSQKSLFVFNALIPARSSREFTFPAPEEAVSSWRVLLFYDYPMPKWRTHVNRLARVVGLSRRVVNDVAQQKAYSESIPKR